MPAAVPVEINGVRYPSMTAAAQALGVQPSTIFRAIELGTVADFRPGRTKRRGVIACGVPFESVSDAARAWGCSRSAVRKRASSPNFPHWQYLDQPKNQPKEN